jgi:tetratricopeptide (TPR) repeat protein
MPPESHGSLCFVLMPFGSKPNPTPPPSLYQFDAVYQQLIAPAITAAGMIPLRADEEMVGGLIHRPMYERLLLCEFAVADLTSANANVFYELGIRHAARPWSTVLLFAEGTRLPFDVAPLRGLRYSVDETGMPRDVDQAVKLLAARLNEARKAVDDSPLFQTLTGFGAPDLSSLKAISFYEQAQQSAAFRDRLDDAVNRKALDTLKTIEHEQGDVSQLDATSAIALFKAYSTLGGWAEMVSLFARMPEYATDTVSVHEQYALALNRMGEDARAERVLLELIEQRGTSSETLGILGRVYKDRWRRAADSHQSVLARGLLDKAIETYLLGFEVDPRDFYPGVNAVTLMHVREPQDERFAELLPVVRYAVQRAIRAGRKGYWEYATALELAVLGGDQDGAGKALSEALAASDRLQMRKTTADNLHAIRIAVLQRGGGADWIAEFEAELVR